MKIYEYISCLVDPGMQRNSHSFFLDGLDSLPNDKILDQSKLNAFADEKNNRGCNTEICFGTGRKHGG